MVVEEDFWCGGIDDRFAKSDIAIGFGTCVETGEFVEVGDDDEVGIGYRLFRERTVVLPNKCVGRSWHPSEVGGEGIGVGHGNFLAQRAKEKRNGIGRANRIAVRLCVG